MFKALGKFGVSLGVYVGRRLLCLLLVHGGEFLYLRCLFRVGFGCCCDWLLCALPDLLLEVC